MLAALGAVHCGAGLVTAAFPREAYAPIAAKLTVTPLLPLPGNQQGTLHVAALPGIREALKGKGCPGKNCLLLGCGLGLNGDTAAITHALLRECEAPLVLDADGINAAAMHINCIKEYPGQSLVLTPHPGEMARLTGLPVEEIQANRAEIARQFAEEYNCVLVLKGAGTVVAAPGREPHTCPLPPNTGLAKGGSGDLLAGMLASLAAQGLPGCDAAVCAVYLHGLAAERAAAKYSQRGMTALDCIDELKGLLAQYE